MKEIQNLLTLTLKSSHTALEFHNIVRTFETLSFGLNVKFGLAQNDATDLVLTVQPYMNYIETNNNRTILPLTKTSWKDQIDGDDYP